MPCFTAAQYVHFDAAIGRGGESLENDRVDELGMLDIQPMGRP